MSASVDRVRPIIPISQCGCSKRASAVFLWTPTQSLIPGCTCRRNSKVKNNKKIKRPVFFLSDRTGITSETLGHALLTQFSAIEFEYYSLPFITSEDKARKAVKQICEAGKKSGLRPIVFSTMVMDEYKPIIAACDAHIIDFFDAFIMPLEKELETHSTHQAPVLPVTESSSLVWSCNAFDASTPQSSLSSSHCFFLPLAHHGHPHLCSSHWCPCHLWLHPLMIWMLHHIQSF